MHCRLDVSALSIATKLILAQIIPLRGQKFTTG